MKLIYKDYVFPFRETNLERIIDGKYFKVNTLDDSLSLQIQLDNEQMLLEFSKSLKATCSFLRDQENEPYIGTYIDLQIFVEEFNKRYNLNAKIIV
ncbi:hypothetical protein FCT18_03575 [Lysinibacillus sphaericus]|uniref:Uncharacterized protein n=3 Tax=Lysinibacillus TaxID=400634 RepID=A0A2S0JYA2_LYSSH|nr:MULTISPECIES: hypothetical protein [Lysinibacillus]AHN22619.1 hypothetical protein T479_15745 [Lysinibacillus varians]AVK96120.1 hypothetical protein LS41612_07570 [Lysinibacillus sphaericus]MCS1383811.1 hypothetical protein [Lysinibacillus sphaericus]MED4544602.1 hypothetical protein [Lysinibacillus sphaericus]TKI20727.1 hypothetical protein FCT18_03575 [Lysinibacillus sphaericus]